MLEIWINVSIGGINLSFELISSLTIGVALQNIYTNITRNLFIFKQNVSFNYEIKV